MGNRNLAIQILQKEFPEAEVGLDNFRPYAKQPDGKMFGCLWEITIKQGQKCLAGDDPSAIIEFTKGYISTRNFKVYKVLAK